MTVKSHKAYGSLYILAVLLFARSHFLANIFCVDVHAERSNDFMEFYYTKLPPRGRTQQF